MDTYTPLLSDPALGFDVDSDKWDSSVPRNSVHAPQRKSEVHHRTVWIVLLATLISLLCLALNIADFRSNLPPPSKKLIYPNPYVGLDRAVLTDAAPAPPIVNFPRVLGQINSSEPSAVHLHQPHWPSFFGMIYPEEREFLVDTQACLLLSFSSASTDRLCLGVHYRPVQDHRFQYGALRSNTRDSIAGGHPKYNEQERLVLERAVPS
jgi:hypothetical protein